MIYHLSFIIQQIHYTQLYLKQKYLEEITEKALLPLAYLMHAKNVEFQEVLKN